MSKKQNGKKVRLEYHYDRLSNRKMAQVYQVLFPSPCYTPPIKEVSTTEVVQDDRIKK